MSQNKHPTPATLMFRKMYYPCKWSSRAAGGHGIYFKLLVETIAAKGIAIASAPGTVKQKLEMERSCTVATLAYHFVIPPM